MTDRYTCPECERECSLDKDGGRWSTKADDMICFSCEELDMSNSSVVYIAEGGTIERCQVGDLFTLDDDLEEPNLNINIHRAYHSTDGWRGHYRTTVDGFETLISGWTTGGWDDPTAVRKQTFNDWVEQILESQIIPPFPVIVVFDPTSNVFSSRVSVFVQDTEEAKEWFEQNSSESIEDLEHSLS